MRLVLFPVSNDVAGEMIRQECFQKLWTRIVGAFILDCDLDLDKLISQDSSSALGHAAVTATNLFSASLPDHFLWHDYAHFWKRNQISGDEDLESVKEIMQRRE